MYRYILLDADNTLFDFDKAETLSLKATLQHFGIAFSKAVNEKYSAINLALWKLHEKKLVTKETIQKKRFSELFEYLGVHADAGLANDIYKKNLEKQSHLMPYAEEVCKALSEKFVLAIVTNGIATTQRSRFALSDINRYIKHLIISEDVGAAKPDVKFFTSAFEIIGCAKKEDILVVGDSLSSDIEGANNVGVDCCWYNPGRIANSLGHDVTYEITGLREMLTILSDEK